MCVQGDAKWAISVPSICIDFGFKNCWLFIESVCLADVNFLNANSMEGNRSPSQTAGDYIPMRDTGGITDAVAPSRRHRRVVRLGLGFRRDVFFGQIREPQRSLAKCLVLRQSEIGQVAADAR